MSWLKISDDFGDSCADLSDSAFRLHVEGLTWVMRRERGPFVADRDVRRFSEGTGDTAAAVAELLAVGFWTAEEGGYVIRHHMEHQPEPDVIAKRRESGADRQRRKRRKAAGLQEGVTP